jgi:hypothetical protein
VARLIIELDTEATGEPLRPQAATEAISAALPIWDHEFSVGQSGSIDLNGEDIGTWEVAP